MCTWLPRITAPRTRDLRGQSGCLSFGWRDRRSLEECDRAFEEHLAVSSPTMRHVDQFLGMCPHSLGATDYAGALADYVVGSAIEGTSNPKWESEEI